VNDEQLLRYSRHILLDEVGVEGQERICAARVLIVGLGGLGSPAALYLAAAGVGQLVLCDDDVVDTANLQRQIIHGTSSLGRAKVDSARDALMRLNPDVEVVALGRRLGGHHLLEQVRAADVVLDCSDNFETRYAVNRACTASARPLVSGTAGRFEGHVSVFDTRKPDSPCYNCLFPEGAPAEEERCALLGVFSPLTGIIGATQAAEALKVIVGCGIPLAGRLLLVDVLDMRCREVAFDRSDACAVCGGRSAAPVNG